MNLNDIYPKIKYILFILIIFLFSIILPTVFLESKRLFIFGVLFIIGLLMNFIVISFNGFKMPVLDYYNLGYINKSHICFFPSERRKIKFFYLSDIFLIVIPTGFFQFFNHKDFILQVSIGDILICFFGLLFIIFSF